MKAINMGKTLASINPLIDISKSTLGKNPLHVTSMGKTLGDMNLLKNIKHIQERSNMNIKIAGSPVKMHPFCYLSSHWVVNFFILYYLGIPGV